MSDRPTVIIDGITHGTELTAIVKPAEEAPDA